MVNLLVDVFLLIFLCDVNVINFLENAPITQVMSIVTFLLTILNKEKSIELG
jgi:hypothetical protein